MVSAVGCFTLQPMARTDHKFPRYGDGHSKGSEIDSKRATSVDRFQGFLRLYL